MKSKRLPTAIALLSTLALLWAWRIGTRVPAPVLRAAVESRGQSALLPLPTSVPATAAVSVKRAPAAAVKPSSTDDAHSPLEWTTRLRDETCACQTFDCAAAIQKRYAVSIGGVDFTRGNPALLNRLTLEAGRCANTLFDAENQGS